MKVKKFEAVDMQEALKLVKAELGPHAVIIQTRKVVKDKAMFGLFGRPVVEVTAAVEGHSLPSPKKKTIMPQSGVTQKAEMPPPLTSGKTSLKGSVNPYTAMGNAKESDSLKEASSKKESEERYNNLSTVNNMITPLKDDVNELRQILEKINQEKSVIEQERMQNSAKETELEDIKMMLHKLVRISTTEKESKELSPVLATFFQRMIKNGLDEKVALKLVQKANDSVMGAFKNKENYLEAYLGNFISKLVKIDGPLQLIPGMPKVVSFVGATGVGKTTTIAKVAAKYKLKEKKKVVLITIDTFRIAAVEQLKIYANILGLPVEVVMTPNDLKDKIKEYSNFDLILIDTAGRSQRESGQLVELKAFLSVVENMETHLLVSTTSNIKVLNETIDRFKEVGFDKLIFTKLDEGGLFGQILNMVIKTQKPLSYFTVGQRVPEDIELATPERVADLILNK
ncbi:MAG: flagellar biosynthesis protein FlhF [Nitrospinae bacterium]|nr:flagellar biosynthesis protein FlhF [Nitrospinota bacterium]